MLSSFLQRPEGYPCPTHNFSATRDKARGHEGTQGASGADRRVRAQGTPQTFRKLTPRTAFVATSEPLPRAIQLRACNVEGISFGDENNTPNGSEPQHYRPSSSNTVATQKPAKGQISDQERSRSIVERGLLCAREAIHSTVPRDRSKEGGAPSTHLGSSKPDRRPDRLQRSKQTDHQQTPAPVSNYPRNGCDLENSKTVRRNESRDRVQRKTVKRYQEGFALAAQKAGLEGVTPHTLKHTAISWLAQGGRPIEGISAMTGTNANTVRRIYQKFAPEYLQEEAEILAKATSFATQFAKLTETSPDTEGAQ